MMWKLAFAVLALSVNLFANLVISVPSGAGVWSAGVAPDENNWDAFWDNRSRDGNRCNIGYWLRDTNWSDANGPGNRCNNDLFVASTGGPGTDLAFLRNTSGPNTPVGWRFQASGPQQATTLRLEVAGWRNSNTFGYGTYDSSGNRITTELFNGPTSPNASAAVNVAAGQEFFFYFCPNGDCTNILYSDTAYSSSDPRSGKFALFSEDPLSPTATSNIHRYWIGVEDTAGSDGIEGWGDFNDFVITAYVVPEPGFYGLLAIGLSGLYLLRRRRNSAD